MLKVSGINDLYRLFLSTEHDGVDFYYIALPADYVRSTDEEFNEAEMNRQYQTWLSARRRRHSLASLAARLCPEGPGRNDRRAIA